MALIAFSHLTPRPGTPLLTCRHQTCPSRILPLGLILEDEGPPPAVSTLPLNHIHPHVECRQRLPPAAGPPPGWGRPCTSAASAPACRACAHDVLAHVHLIQRQLLQLRAAHRQLDQGAGGLQLEPTQARGAREGRDGQPRAPRGRFYTLHARLGREAHAFAAQGWCTGRSGSASCCAAGAAGCPGRGAAVRVRQGWGEC